MRTWSTWLSASFRPIAGSSARSFTTLAAGVVLVMPLTSLHLHGGEPITVSDVSDLLRAEVSEDVIRAKLELDGCRCDASASAIIDLVAVGASDELIIELIGSWTNGSAEREPMTIQDAVAMLASGVKEHIVAAKLHTDGCRCDTSAQAIIELKSVGATDDFVVELIRYGVEPER